MTRNQPISLRVVSYPWTVTGWILVTAFVIELAIMLTMAWWTGFTTTAILVALIDAAILAAVMTPILWWALVRPIKRLAEQRGDLLGLLFQAQDRDRAALAGDLHDELGQSLTALLLGLRSMDQSPDLASARALAETARRQTADCIESVRGLARGLAPASLSAFGLRAALEQLAKDMSNESGVQVVTDMVEAADRFEPTMETTLYRIAQEAVTNVVRHADATTARLSLRRDDDSVTLTIQDDGSGIPPERASRVGGKGKGASLQTLGIRGMMERSEAAGGKFSLLTDEINGTRIVVTLPRIPVHE